MKLKGNHEREKLVILGILKLALSQLLPFYLSLSLPVCLSLFVYMRRVFSVHIIFISWVSPKWEWKRQRALVFTYKHTYVHVPPTARASSSCACVRLDMCIQRVSGLHKYMVSQTYSRSNKSLMNARIANNNNTTENNEYSKWNNIMRRHIVECEWQPHQHLIPPALLSPFFYFKNDKSASNNSALVGIN